MNFLVNPGLFPKRLQ